MHYFDHCATTPPFAEVIEAVAEVMKVYYGNPSSLHRLGVEADRLLSQARDVIARCLRVHPENLVFTSGGTESNNLALKGVAERYRDRGKHIITTQIEHPSVYNCAQFLEANGYHVTYLPVDATGAVKLDDVKSAITDETILVSVMHVNNETGRIQPIEQIGKWLKQYPRILFHVDAVQSIGKVPIDPEAWGIDLMSVSAHKIRGPKGIGFLYKRKGIQLTPLFEGGGQEQGIRSGTENVPLIVGMAKAIRLTMEHQPNQAAYLSKLRNKIVYRIQTWPELVLNSSRHAEEMAPHVINFSFPGMKSEVVVHALEKRGIFVSSKSACSSGDERPSRVLLAMGCDSNRAKSGIRISLSAQHKEEDIDDLLNALQAVVEDLKPIARSVR